MKGKLGRAKCGPSRRYKGGAKVTVEAADPMVMVMLLHQQAEAIIAKNPGVFACDCSECGAPNVH